MAFLEKREGHYSDAMLAANVAFIVGAIVWINVLTLLGVATAILPATERVMTLFALAVLGVVLWFLVFALAKREVVRARALGPSPHESPRLIFIYAIASAVALFASMALLIVN